MSIDTSTIHEYPSEHVAATLNFFVPNGEKPKVLMAEDHTQENQRTGKFKDTFVKIYNGRMLKSIPTLDREGFELKTHASDVEDFYNEDQITNRHYAEIIEFLKLSTGATDVHIFDYTLRVQDMKKRSAHDTRGPVYVVHNDYTEKSGPQRISDLLSPEKAKRFFSGRYAFVNVWRSIGPDVQRLPLAVADARFMAKADFVATDMVYSDRKGEIYQVASNQAQRWTYFPDMTHEEVLLLKCFDSASDGRARYTAHGAFEDPTVAADVPPRESIEIRTLLSFV